MRLLVIGAGGREHALAWRLAQASGVEKVWLAPGNGGTAGAERLENVPLSEVPELVDFARREAIDLTVVGPEAPLAAGVVDAFQAAGLKIFGPTRAAARLESSKAYAKTFMVRNAIPTAQYQTFTDATAARNYVLERGTPIVLKADGLAAGKGVIVALDLDTALRGVDDILGGAFGDAGARLVIEDYLEGEEASFIVLCDGRHILPLASSQDHKRLLDGDKGPNTGGMGACSPAPIVSPALHERILHEVIRPAVRGMERDGTPYTGFLYAGLMIGPGDDASRRIRVLEFNCRLGDPEAQPILMRLKGDLPAVFQLALQGRLDEARIEWDPRPAIGVVLASQGYPGHPRTGVPITALAPDTPTCMTFHAATRLEDGQLHTSGGRVLCVTALGNTFVQARQRVYEAVGQTRFEGCQFRQDIGWRALGTRSHDQEH